MGALRDYLQGLARIHATGEAVEETSYYGQMERLLNAIGGRLSPKIVCVLTTRNRGAGVPDGGLFIGSRAVEQAGREVMVARVPERGVMEVKGPGKDVRRIARSQQVRRYLTRYGKVLVTTYREFLVVGLGEDGQPVVGEAFSLAHDEEGFWALVHAARQVAPELETDLEDYLRRALLGDAPLSQPADLAWFLAAYAREGRKRLDSADARHMNALATLREAMEDGLGLRFEGEEGERFFRSALVQTLFYGVFAAWVVWSESQLPGSQQRFSWKSAQWTLKVPMVRVLFQQLATPATLPVGLDEVLDWTEDTLARVDRTLFFNSFESGNAVQYFYEPFLEAYDPDLRRQLGVWYTPPEVVRYMVMRVHQSLQQDLGLELGLADENVHVLDPCTGTGSFLVETIETIARVLEDRHGDALVAQDAKAAALSRVYGFELLPAPFVIAHLNIALTLDRLGAPLSSDERAKVYLTNALTGWVETDEHPRLPFPEFEEERDAAIDVKRSQPVLVVLGNPPYNGFAGVSGREEGGLVEPYKQGLSEKWDITKNKLDDLYIRFFRVAERRIAEQTGKGIVCFISNFSWLGDPSAVVMRQELVSKFDRLYVDNLNGDSRETGKKTPDGLKDPSIFSTKLNPAGIQVGTAVTLLVRQDAHDASAFEGSYRDFWGADKRRELLESLSESTNAPHYAPLLPTKENWYRLRRWSPRQGYEQWPAIPDLALADPLLGLNENRGDALISTDREQLLDRLCHFLDSDTGFTDLDDRVAGLTQTWARYDPQRVRAKLLAESPYDQSKAVRFCVKPFDVRWAYVDTTGKLWNESRDELVKAATIGSDFLLLRRRAPRALDGAAFLLSRCLIDQHVMHKDAYVVPFYLATDETESSDNLSLFDLHEESPSASGWRPNLSPFALDYLSGLGITDAQTSQLSAQLLWQHVLAVGYSPLYLEENGDAIRNDWPRVPLPSTYEQLATSAQLGQQIADLLDIDATNTLTTRAWRTIAQVTRDDGERLSPEAGDLAISVGWAIEQRRKQKSGATSRIVMPGRGRITLRERTDNERHAFTNEELELLGAEVVDVYLNDKVYWRGVPEAVWDFKIGGFQVLRKWLSYRDKNILGRDLTIAEVRQFTSICLRLTELVLLGPQLDENYKAAAGS
ncbi:type ISP restriction/modification enzyme [Streptomyces poonensis]|uniref:site-specific DNA-methyltransferase (adenine-specific) n=1 Tax=Streptomyces poonensis TaxID=68255 RepID=A0A918UXQ2_9ACTN|nr:type ISP restriction/modification enzyme [Streptomyces poonensis]GGZ40340.1 DNA methyltransferase [Streptomyces poonensis]GLJ93010.1 DNA methyltransferase [Streptomyces poonensis]